MTRIFVSSTCYDLLDVRAEIKALLEEMSLKPVMSDDIDHFELSGRADSIETCLANVRNSDAVLCVLSQRYGPSLAKAGYPDVSATHLEYREAKARRLPIHVFVRDRLEAEYSLAKKHRAVHSSLDGFQTRWVPKADYGLFTLLDEHVALAKDAETTNWYTLFSDVVDLKARVQRILSQASSRATLAKLLDAGALPIFSASVAHWRDRPASGVLIRNSSKVPALDVKVVVTTKQDIRSVVLGDLTDSNDRPVVLGANTEPLPTMFSIHFTTGTGYRVSQDFLWHDGAYKRSTLRLQDRGGFQLG